MIGSLWEDLLVYTVLGMEASFFIYVFTKGDRRGKEKDDRKEARE